MPSREALCILQWNAGGLSQSKRAELVQSLNTHDMDAFTIIEGYSLYILHQSRQVASGMLVGVKTGLTADFRIIKDMDCSPDKSEVIKLNLWKNGKRFSILTIYSTPNNKPDFSYLNSDSNCFPGRF
ncbi:hypothetical protein TNIN_73271 [Trichonephila inaurata madagascariensis]|uniref:Uncharacterized protein n=1 Tax=Trichonephila inaurata madagascariensis TaxID=2747483 RepID=A0A8X6YVM8_9ARAC|nr:hypothetical protein TNIN_73271 [Trichonephila inaurata madagascariensis]